MSSHPFNPLRALATLNQRGVRFVVIGGLAGRLWGSPIVTNDLDVCYARDRKNLEALAAALRELNARLRGAPEDLPFQLEARALELGDRFTFVTDAGNLDILGAPTGTGGFSELVRTAREMDLGEMRVSVAAIEDLIRMKRCAARPKDLIELEVLSALRDEIERGGSGT